MNMDPKTSIAGYCQAAVAILSCFGVVVSPEHSASITAGTIALLGVLGAVKGHFTKDKEK